MNIRKTIIAAALISSFAMPALAHRCKQAMPAPVIERVNMKIVASGYKAKSIGYVTLQDSEYGLLIVPHLHDVPTGFHGFHVHTYPTCSNNGNAAGGHFDPQNTGKHLGPYDDGHLGDLPVLYANRKGIIDGPVIAPRVKLHQVQGHSLMLHEGGDNYSDQPSANGGGGMRYACGVIK